MILNYQNLESYEKLSNKEKDEFDFLVNLWNKNKDTLIEIENKPLAKLMNMSERTLQRYLNKFEKLNLITREFEPLDYTGNNPITPGRIIRPHRKLFLNEVGNG